MYSAPIFMFARNNAGKAGNVGISTATAPANDTVEVGSGPFKMYFSLMSGQLERVVNYRTGVSYFSVFNCHMPLHENLLVDN